MSFRIRTKLIIAFLAIIIPYMVIAGIISLYNLNIVLKGSHRVEAVTGETHKSHELQLALDMALMPVNDYVITGEKRYMEEFQKASVEVERRLKEVEGKLAGLEGLFPAEVKEEREILKDARASWQKINEISQRIFAIQDPVGNSNATALMVEMDYKWAYPAIEGLRRWQEIDKEEHREAHEESERALRKVVIVMIAGGAILFIFGSSFAVFYSRMFVRPIEALHEIADAIATGDFKTRLDIRTGDEIQQLGNAMNEMAAQLDSLYSNLNGMVEERTRELRESEEKYRTMIENSNDMIWTLAPDGRFTFANKQTEGVSGHSIEEWLGKRFDPLVLEEDLPMVLDIHNKVVKGEKAHYEVRVKKKDGGIMILSVNASPIFKDDKVTGTISFGRDITEQKQAEAAFRTLVGTAATNLGAAFFHETASSLCRWLGVECAIIGELVDENKVRALAMQLDGKAVEHYEYALAGTPCESASQKGYCEYHEEVVQLFPLDKDLVVIGAEAYVGIPVRDKYGKVSGILCAISRHKFAPPPVVKEVFAIIAARAGVEIERKKAEEALKYERDNLTRVFEAMKDGVYLVDQDYNIQYLNLVLLKEFGPIEEKKCYAYFHDRTEVCPWCPNERIFAGETVRWEWTSLKNGKTYDLLDTPMRQPDGSIWKLEIFRDITDKKQAEEKIKEQLDYLERFKKVAIKREFRIKELVDEVEKLKAEIEELKKINL